MGAVVGTHDDVDVVRALARASSDGLVVRRGARTEWASDTAYAILLRTGLPEAEALRQLRADVPPWTEDGSAVRRQVRIENPATRTIVHLETSATNLRDGRYAVWLRDLGEQRAQHDRITAIATAALSVADTGSLDTTLTTLAREVRLAAGLAAVQVVTVHGDDPLLRIIGRYGFGPADDFSLRLDRARRGGAHLMLTTAVREKRVVIALHRKAEIMQDPLWEPMHAIFAEVDWDCFGAFPIIARDRVVGVLIAFFHPGADPDDQMIELISDLADQAAIAVDYATLIAISRDEARRRERERIATDLHDSVVQQVFSIRLLARALED